MNVAVISLSPLGRCGGSERYTLDAIQAIRAQEDTCEAFAIREGAEETFVHTFDGDLERELPFSEVLRLLRRFDLIWVHQYLANALILDILTASRGRVPLLLTNLGDETVLSDFRAAYRPARHHRFVHPTRRLGAAGQSFGAIGQVVTAGIWADSLGATNPVAREPSQLCMLDGLAPEAGLETLVRALPDPCSLIVTGALRAEDPRHQELRRTVQGRNIWLTGQVPETRRRAVLASSRIVVAAHNEHAGNTQHPRLDPFASVVLLEAVGFGTQPIASDAGSHPEIMNALGFGDRVFPAGDSAALAELITLVLAAPEQESLRRIERARDAIRRSFLWDNYWPRLLKELGLAKSRRVAAAKPGRAAAAPARAALAESMWAFGWKTSPV